MAQLIDTKINKILMVLAHPDDEVIFGWPLLQNYSINKELIICSSDALNPQRKWCAHRKQPLIDLCTSLNINLTCLDYNSDFYSYPNRHKKYPKNIIKRLIQKKDTRTLISEFMNDILENIKSKKFDAIFTHNPWGEYGHMDHIILHNLILHHYYDKKPILFTDTHIKLDWMPLCDDLHRITSKFKLVESFTNNENLYNNFMQFYKKTKTWTWSVSPVKKTNILTLM